MPRKLLESGGDRKSDRSANLQTDMANLKNGGDRKSDQAANLPLDSITQAKAAEMLNVPRIRGTDLSSTGPTRKWSLESEEPPAVAPGPGSGTTIKSPCSGDLVFG